MVQAASFEYIEREVTMLHDLLLKHLLVLAALLLSFLPVHVRLPVHLHVRLRDWRVVVLQTYYTASGRGLRQRCELARLLLF
jgi:hypothetical protein